MNSLRAFEAAARHSSFTGAADELCVTPGAVAQQVKSLEAWIGGKLFERQAQGIELTTLGENALPAFSLAFDHLGEAVNTLRSSATPNQIRIAALPSIAQLWVSPRLPALRAAVPELNVSVTAMEQPPNLMREPFDLSIFFESNATDADSLTICNDEIFPVCSPSYAKRLNSLEELEEATFLHDVTLISDWELWLGEVAPSMKLDTNGSGFSLYSLALEEVRNGAGVLMGHEPLVRNFLQDGSLVAPFDLRVKLNRVLTMQIGKAARGHPLLREILNTLGDFPEGSDWSTPIAK